MCQKASLISLILLVGLSFNAIAQNYSIPETTPKKKRGLYFLWGYNRDQYTKSNIHFVSKADNYDFVLHNATATDRPSVEGWWKPNRLTIPQYDVHLGYMFGDKHDLGIEIGWEHLKYVVNDNQNLLVTGQINGTPVNGNMIVTPDFVHLQHTNGNNYALVNLVKRHELWASASRKIVVNAIGKAGLGPLMSVTITKVMGENHRTGFQYQGWVFPVSAGLRINLYNYFFVQGDVQGAYVDYIHSRVGGYSQGTASQHFYSLQWMWAGGFCYPF